MSRKRITLSFDNGPHPVGTPLILDLLAERTIKAWFFLVGERLKDPALHEIAERVHDAGHLIANHTMTHRRPLGERPAADARAEIDEAQEMLGALAAGRVFRPNGDFGKLGPHLLSEGAVQHLAAGKYTAVNWNCVPRDWEGPGDAWIGRAFDTMATQDWTLIVLHDHTAGTQSHLGHFLDHLDAEGYEFSLEFPPDAVMLDQGRPTIALEGMVAAA